MENIPPVNPQKRSLLRRDNNATPQKDAIDDAVIGSLGTDINHIRFKGGNFIQGDGTFQTNQVPGQQAQYSGNTWGPQQDYTIPYPDPQPRCQQPPWNNPVMRFLMLLKNMIDQFFRRMCPPWMQPRPPEFFPTGQSQQQQSPQFPGQPQFPQFPQFPGMPQGQSYPQQPQMPQFPMFPQSQQFPQFPPPTQSPRVTGGSDFSLGFFELLFGSTRRYGSKNK